MQLTSKSAMQIKFPNLDRDTLKILENITSNNNTTIFIRKMSPSGKCLNYCEPEYRTSNTVCPNVFSLIKSEIEMFTMDNHLGYLKVMDLL